MDVHPTKKGIFIGIDPYPYILYPGSIISLNLKLRQLQSHLHNACLTDHPSDANQWHIVALSRALFKGFFIGLHPTYQHYILYMCMDNIHLYIYIYPLVI